MISKGIGQPPMLALIEPRVVIFINMSSRCNQEMIRQEVLDFVNAYIQGSKLEEEYIAWKIIHTKNGGQTIIQIRCLNLGRPPVMDGSTISANGENMKLATPLPKTQLIIKRNIAST